MPRFGLLFVALLLVSGSLVAQSRTRLEIKLKDGVAVIEADQLLQQGGVSVATGNVVITYKDYVLKTDSIRYDPANGRSDLDGNVDLKKGKAWLRARRAEINLEKDTGTFFQVDGFTDEEIFVKARSVVKTGPDTYIAYDGILTSCAEALPKWSFRIKKANIKIDSWATAKNTVFRVKKIPVFYLPYLLFPTAKKERQSGFLLPSTGTSNNRGRRVSTSFFLALGRSADITYNQDYFSERGLGYGFILRARPNPVTRFELDGYAVNDRLDQGGASLNGEGETRFSGYRAVTKFNLVSSFQFRQVFSDNFFTATRPTETSQFFLTRSARSAQFSFLASRDETAFPGPNAVVRTLPSLLFKVSGYRLFDTPFFADLDSSITGLNRSDSSIETSGLTQRFDFFPRLYFSVPLVKGLRVTPSVAVRNTYYSDSLMVDEDGLGRRELGGEGFNRQYFDFTLDLKGWGLAKVYQSENGEPRFKHVFEPRLRYRFTDGIGDDFRRTLIFDEIDAIANTNEVELSLFNRFFVKRDGQTREWLSIKVGQKYFFDPDFGGALREGSVNQFFPLYTFTGFQYGSIVRNSSPLTTVVRITPRPRFSFDVRTDYDPDFNRLRNFSINGAYSRPKIFLGATYFTTRELEPGTFLRNQLQGQYLLGNIKRGLSVSGLFSYDLEGNRFLNYRARANYFWDCCGVSVEVQGFNFGVRDERQIRFSFLLKGIGSFGTIKQPNRVF